MVSPEELEAFDLMCWLGNGQDAARLAFCNQSTISRRSQHVLKLFKLNSTQHQDCQSQLWSGTLLRMEREVHQLYRLAGGCPLRLHAPYWASRRLEGQLQAGWIVNPARQKEPVGAALRLLEDRVIDAMITETCQRPAGNNHNFVCFDLYEVDLITYAEVLAEKQAAKPLYSEKNLSPGDIGALSHVKPQSFLSQESKECVVQLYDLLYGVHQGADRRSSNPYEDSLPVTFFMAHHTSAFEDFGRYRPIDYDCSFRARESLVVLRGMEESPKVLRLLETLSRSYLEPLGRYSSVTIDRAMV